MSFDVLRPAATSQGRASPLFCLALLAASCALASFALACATPFAAFAVLAAAMLPLSFALLVVGAAWIVNQAIGFGVIGYPIDPNTLLWGVAIGAAALIATTASALVLSLLARANRYVAVASALVAAYAAYEMVLLAFTPVLGGIGAFTLAIIARLGFLNILWMTGLLAVCAVAQILHFGSSATRFILRCRHPKGRWRASRHFYRLKDV